VGRKFKPEKGWVVVKGRRREVCRCSGCRRALSTRSRGFTSQGAAETWNLAVLICNRRL